MGQRIGHPPLRRAGRAWLAAIADPERKGDWPSPPLTAAELPALLAAAAAHAVLPAALRNLRLAAAGAAGWAPVLAAAEAEAVATTGNGLLLLHQAKHIARALEGSGLGWTFVKGPVFARRLYPSPGDRTFTDLDILAAPADAAAVGAALRGLGYQLASADEGPERKWLLKGPATVMVEVQTDLVHSARLGRGVSLGHDDLAAAGGGESAEALLLVAAVHGAAGHQFERLQHVIDVAQAVRRGGPLDRRRLAAAAERTGAGLAIAAALDVAAAVTGDPAVAGLARQWQARRRWLARRLVTPGVIVAAQSTRGGRGSWRRQALRTLLARPAPRGAASDNPAEPSGNPPPKR